MVEKMEPHEWVFLNQRIPGTLTTVVRFDNLAAKTAAGAVSHLTNFNTNTVQLVNYDTTNGGANRIQRVKVAIKDPFIWKEVFLGFSFSERGF